MHKKLLAVGLWLLILSCFFSAKDILAAQDPLSFPNNQVGIHILNPSELDTAKDLVNSNGGDWGYVTIPIQYSDRNIEKWQAFMDVARKNHLIPLIRIATDPYWKNTAVWRKPTDEEILDFANFLNSLAWPTKNRYVILYNEVNRFDEWGGETPSPTEYANLVSYARVAFKTANPNFYLILAGMDVAAPTNEKYINGFTFLEEMAQVPGFSFSAVDGFSSHSYPNPDFSAPPLEGKRVGVATYRFEYDIINRASPRKIPAFITETGWNANKLPGNVIADYYKLAFENIWSRDKDKLVAITPFVLSGEGGPFDKFTFLKSGNKMPSYNLIAGMSKIKGAPALEPTPEIVGKSFVASETLSSPVSVLPGELSYLVKGYIKTMFGLR